MMKWVYIGAVACGLGTQAFADPVTRLTTNLLERITTESESASNAKDSVTLLSHLASNVVINVSFPRNPEIPSLRFTKQTYEANLQDGWTQMETFTVRRLTTQYDVAADGQSALVTATLLQNGTVRATGQTVTSVAKGVTTVRLVDGRPLAVKVDVTVTFK
jgi:hypothetical protein